ncbi:hypothetical protein TVAG_071610 [Trichomonas vaginalis G3]|uniref:Uncharacterized protein n=1 Tax=Trichomonas vaginalis (strain ATCC PRA-98 / G3) TaxID=412133 RepID=A2D864_TRIV3|nr:hypothetical protein TVAGG3_1046710 [Trichomonas vaginalis G3]EAY23497.1 hypothetical protein TVAG_071610 [Trichomonas vaginalis G3]KAI5493919.1 hypothetical protein TVAGG3_1046710 [Trichomonas vaginalis G3]|eukprot:XP_001584483.1 hypothetical protein [Trichomonas vaginalis G3]
MWAPSKYVCARPAINLQAYAQISGAEYIQENNMLQFKSIDDATSFIGNFNPQHGNNVILYYARPPNINLNINTNLVM